MQYKGRLIVLHSDNGAVGCLTENIAGSVPVNFTNCQTKNLKAGKIHKDNNVLKCKKKVLSRYSLLQRVVVEFDL